MKSTLQNFCVRCESPEQIRPVVEWMNENRQLHQLEFSGNCIGALYGCFNRKMLCTYHLGNTPIITVEQFLDLLKSENEKDNLAIIKE